MGQHRQATSATARTRATQMPSGIAPGKSQTIQHQRARHTGSTSNCKVRRSHANHTETGHGPCSPTVESLRMNAEKYSASCTVSVLHTTQSETMRTRPNDTTTESRSLSQEAAIKRAGRETRPGGRYNNLRANSRRRTGRDASNNQGARMESKTRRLAKKRSAPEKSIVLRDVTHHWARRTPVSNGT